MGWPKGKKRGPVEQGNAAHEATEEQPQEVLPAADAPATDEPAA